MKFESEQIPSQKKLFRDFYSFVTRELPNGLTGAENVFPVQIGNVMLDVVIFEPYDQIVPFGLFVKEEQRIPVEGNEEFPGHVVGKYARKILEINKDGEVTEDTSGTNPVFDEVAEEPDFGSLANTDIAAQVIEQIRSYKRPQSH